MRTGFRTYKDVVKVENDLSSLIFSQWMCQSKSLVQPGFFNVLQLRMWFSSQKARVAGRNFPRYTLKGPGSILRTNDLDPHWKMDCAKSRNGVKSLWSTSLNVVLSMGSDNVIA